MGIKVWKDGKIVDGVDVYLGGKVGKDVYLGICVYKSIFCDEL